MEIAVDALLERVDGSSFWLTYLRRAFEPVARIGIHVAIFSDQFLIPLLDGRKTIESRFSRNRCAPYGEVDAGDVILVKKVAGPICGVALAKQVRFYDLATERVEELEYRYSQALCADEEFWNSKRDAAYATLIELSEAMAIEPLGFEKQDRRGWVALRPRQLMFAF